MQIGLIIRNWEGCRWSDNAEGMGMCCWLMRCLKFVLRSALASAFFLFFRQVSFTLVLDINSPTKNLKVKAKRAEERDDHPTTTDTRTPILRYIQLKQSINQQ
jgi:hypothetical protein